MLTAALLVLVLLAVGLWKGWHARPCVDKALPGPRAFPLIGDMPHLFHADLPRHFLKLAQRYGPIYRLRFGRKDVVVLNSSDLIREALIRKWSDFAGRPHSFVADLISLGGKDLSLGNYSPTWRLQRKMAHTALQRSLREDLEQTVQNTAQRLCKVLHGQDGRLADVAHLFSLHTSWVISSLVFGPLDLDVVEEMHDCMIDLVESWNAFSVQILDVLPFLKVFPNASLQRLLRLIKRRDALIQSQLRKHPETPQPTEGRSLVERMLHFVREHEAEAGRPGDAALTQEHVHMAIVDLLIGGTETTAALLTWVVAFLLHHPQVEEQIHQELMAVVGLSRDPTYSDREHLPYLSATILETLRLRPSAPLALPHTATRDTSLCGFSIPRGTTVIPNLYGAHHDPSKWDQPLEFRPERFLEGSGSAKAQRHLVPFSCGVRICLGEAVARMESFLFLAHILRDFQIMPSTPGCLPDLQEHFGFLVQCKPFMVRLVPRLVANPAE